MLLTPSLYSQIDPIGSGRAISFDGIDDYIDFGNIYSDLKLPFTVSAWAYLDPASNQAAPIFSNRNCDPVYTGFRLMINSSLISVEYGDGVGGNNPAFRKGKQADVDLLKGSWNHITAVVRSVSDMDLYLNGIRVVSTFSGSSNLTMDSSKPGFATSAYFISNGTVYRFKGMIDDIRLWNRSLTEDEIRQTMCIKLTGNEPGLIGYWDFNEISGTVVSDKSSNHFSGTFVGNPIRVFSGAPIGDKSTYAYSNLTGQTVFLTDGDYKIEVKNISSTAGGVQVYEVKNSPSQTSGLNLSMANKPYFGVFMAKQNTSSSFNAEYTFQGSNTCAFVRDDNSTAVWASSANPSVNKTKRLEMVSSGGSSMTFDLGPDRILCDQSSFEISTGITDPQFTFQWSNNKTTPSVNVKESGMYIVRMTGPCGVLIDSVMISFFQRPAPFSLGDDIESCNFEPVLLQPLANPDNYKFLWQDGSTNPVYAVKDFGKYSVSIKNSCGQVSDTIVFTKQNNGVDFADLGPDRIFCDQNSFEISTGITDLQFTFKWSNNETTPSINVTQSAKYSVKINGTCGTVEDSVMISFFKAPNPVSLGEDAQFCDFKPVTLHPISNPSNYTFLWQDGSTDSLYVIKDFGTYWVSIENLCGQVSDTIVFKKQNYTAGFVPNVVTPNQDGTNDYFMVEQNLIGMVSLKVISRWGELVYYSESYNNNWNGDGVSAGIYFILLEGSCMEKTKGVLHIIH